MCVRLHQYTKEMEAQLSARQVSTARCLDTMTQMRTARCRVSS
jgi:hypothetical protein